MDDAFSDTPPAEREASGEPGSCDEPQHHSPAALLSLRQAMRRARFDEAERSGVIADLRAARLGRLEVLHEALRPLLAQIPAEVDYFDVGIMPGVNPRLFVDMIGFVEMGRDPRLYRFFQDTRHGRVTLAESESVDRIVEAVTQYVARRLLERDKALAADVEDLGPLRHAQPVKSADAPVEGPRPRRLGLLQLLALGFAFLIDVLGSIAFFSLLAFAAWFVWSMARR